MKPLTQEDEFGAECVKNGGMCDIDVFERKDVKSAVEMLKERIKNEINNPYTSEPKVHLGVCLKWVYECFPVFQEQLEEGK